MSGASNVGGLVGFNNSGSVRKFLFHWQSAGGRHVGGLVGYNESGRVYYSYATGNVSGNHIASAGWWGLTTTARSATATPKVMCSGVEVLWRVGRAN